MYLLRFVLFLLAAVACIAQSRDAEFARLADRYFDEVLFRYDPAQATQAGFHQYDTQLPSASRAEFLAQIEALKKLDADVTRFDPRGLSPEASADRELLLGEIRGRLLMLDTLRFWEKNPDSYSSGVTNSIFVIMSRSFAPSAERLKSAIAREKLIPRVFQSARENLTNPPKIYTEVALEQLPGMVSFFENDVPKAFVQVKDPALMAEFQSANRKVIAALRSYETFLKKELLPRSKGDFKIGAENFRRKLLYDEM